MRGQQVSRAIDPWLSLLISACMCSLFDHAKRQVCDMRSLHRSDVFKVDRPGLEAVEQADPISDQDRGNVHMDFIDEPGSERLLQDAWRADDHILVACSFLCLM